MCAGDPWTRDLGKDGVGRKGEGDPWTRGLGKTGLVGREKERLDAHLRV